MEATANIKIYTEEEINVFLEGDRRTIDRLILHSLNNFAVIFMAHAQKEESIFEAMGSDDEIRIRTKWIDAEIKKKQKLTEMMDKVITSVGAGVILAFLGFLVHASVSYLVTLAQSKLGTPPIPPISPPHH